MIIDVHTHLWPAATTPKAFADYFTRSGMTPSDVARAMSAEGLLESMDTAGVAKSIVVAFAYGAGMSATDLEPLNDYVLAECAQSDRLIPFGTVDPLAPDAAARMRALLDDGFKGLKLHGNIQRFYPDDPAVYPVYEVLGERKAPVLFHSGGIGVVPFRDAYGHPSVFDAVASEFPDLPIILGHAGRISYTTTAELLRKHPNVYAEVSSNLGRTPDTRTWPLDELCTTVKGWAGATSHILFGSDYPLYGQSQTLAALTELAGRVELEGHRWLVPEDVTAIAERNSEAFCAATGLI